ncbi:hypothetical protein BDN70DRAFT_918565 [Pholiota conissans]|uniref:Uncharacterized protein n=1 Tax=Pholiota conissans TaxID=109636 RepID=A0A9P5Z9B9_9AGAR|nr:hypothetical protein BDN70DRAFT_918565 [Pholiota conissans]
MAQPTQEFPPWLAPSAFLVTNAAGATVATETTILYIPPTYFGPSIPLGTLYVFGGSSEPATVILPNPTPQTTTTVAPPSTTAITSLTTPLTTTATPTTTIVSSTSATSLSSLTTSATSTSTTSASSVSNTLTSVASISSSSSVSTTSTSTSTSSPTSIGPAAMAGLTKGQLVGVIVASILGLIFLFVLALFLYLWCRGRRNRRGFNSFSQGIDDDYYFVPPGGGRVPGEGSPRHSGEEADPFLQRSSGAGWAAESSTAAGTSMGMASAATAGGAAAMIPREMSNVPSDGPRPIGSRIPPPTTGSNASDSTASHASGFGVLIDRPSMSLGLLPIPSDTNEHRMSGTALSERDMARIGRESVLPDELDQYPDEEYTGAYAYSRDSQYTAPRLVGPSATTPLLEQDERLPLAAEGSPELLHQTSFEEPTLLTARRVKVEDLGPRTASQTSSPATAVPAHRGSGGFLGALGLGGLGRLSWFSSPRNSGAAASEPAYDTDPLSEKDLETGRALLSPADAVRQVDSFGNRPRGVGQGPDGSRPVSARSGTSASGATVYLDAQSSVPGTPVLAPLPRAITPADNGHQSQGPLSEYAWLAGSPPGYEALPLLGAGPSTSTSPMQSPTGTSFDQTLSADILDMPAPTALTHFASISSLKETATGSSAGYKSAPFPPPGLETIRPVSGWTDVAGANVSPVGPFGYGMHLDDENVERAPGISIDVLEEAPPDAELGWRSMAAAQGMGHDIGHRGTFGTYVPGFGGIITSEQGSLHSMRSHFSPSSRSTGSAPTSRRDFDSSVSSAASSRPSAANSPRMGSRLSHHSGAAAAATHSLSHKGSLSSDNRHRAISPALSAFGHQTRHGSASGSGSGSGHEGGSALLAPPIIGSPPSAHFSPQKASSNLALRPVGSGSDVNSVMDTSFGSTVRGVQPARSLSPLSATFPLNTPWAGGLDSDWQPSM